PVAAAQAVNDSNSAPQAPVAQPVTATKVTFRPVQATYIESPRAPSFLSSAAQYAGEAVANPMKVVSDFSAALSSRWDKMVGATVDWLKLVSPGWFDGNCQRYCRIATEKRTGVKWHDNVPATYLGSANQFLLFANQGNISTLRKIGFEKVPTLTPDNKPNLQ